ncbi:MAG: hypothetical protein IJM33_00205 [Bacteroidales bacterium]|nr:hypothetical protein [Bacteroidales bacterium]
MRNIQKTCLYCLLLLGGTGLLPSSPTAQACGPWIFGPGDISLYRIMPYWQEEDYLVGHSNFVSANCQLWAQQVGGGVTPEAVNDALYHHGYNDWKALQQWYSHGGMADSSAWLWQGMSRLFGYSCNLRYNDFVTQLLAADDREALDYLFLCKEYEEVRKQQLSPWYYSCGWDDCDVTMDSIANSALSYDGQRYADRYLLLAAKSLYTLRSNDECVRLWEQRGSLLPTGTLRDEMEGYVAGCYLRQGQREKALEIYRRLGDIPSLLYVMENVEQVCEYLYDLNPQNPYFRPTLQKFLYSLENYDLWSRYEGYGMAFDSVQRVRLLHLCERAMTDGRNADKAPWRYTAAAIHDHYGHPAEALRCLQGAEEGCTDAFLVRSIRIFRCYLHARIDSVDDRYEQFLLGELRWLDAELQKEYASLDAATQYGLQHIDELTYSSLYALYTHDAMRKILLEKDGACARLAQQGRSVRALQLANMAENRLFAITHNELMPMVRTRLGQFEYAYSWGDFDYYEVNPDSLRHAQYVDTLSHNNHDYSNRAFWIADTMTASRLVEYFQRTAGAPRDEFDRFLADKGYRDTNYWYEIIGTHYLREGDYYNAVRYLRVVSPDFVNNQNIDFEWDPFSYDRQPLRYKWHPKLVYAERMLWLERQMKQERDPDRLGLLMLSYSIALRNAADLCWQYLSYGRTCDDYAYWNEYSEYYEPDWQTWFSPNDMLPNGHAWYDTRECRRQTSALADQWQRQAFLTIRGDEAQAYAYRQLCFFDRIRKHYPHTQVAQSVARHCDTRRQY